MPTPVPRLAAILLGLVSPPGSGAGEEGPPSVGVEVAAAALDARVEPDETAPVAARLRKGDRVRPAGEPSAGWLPIEPGATAFSWVEAAALDGPRDGGAVARVSAPRAVTRIGVEGARLPGPPGVVLKGGDEVRLLDRPAARLPGASGAPRAWLAIAPPPGTRHYVRADGVRAPPETPGPAREIRASFDGESTPFPPEVAAEVGRIEAEHRAAVSGPVETWRLDAVRRRYEYLLGRVSAPPAAAEIRRRLAAVARQDEVARSARSFAALLDASRRRDGRVTATRRTLAEREKPSRRAYAAEGLVQPSSRQVEGRRVFALIGTEGRPVAYLDIPPGLDARPVLAKRVGVRGAVHYDENLGARLIAVRDIEPLE